MHRPTPRSPTPLLSPKEAAAHLGLKPQTLRKWRVSGRGPRYLRLGDSSRARVAYRLADLDEWLDQRSFAHTAEETLAAS